MIRSVIRTAIVALFFVSRVAAETPATEPIADNSFLIEEAYNQEEGVVQHIQTFARSTRGNAWNYTFTQEWPVASIRHQFSYTLPLQQIGGDHGVGDVALTYRYQVANTGSSRVAISPRASLLLPTGSERRGLGSGAMTVQTMLPVSIEATPSIVVHLNLGAAMTGSNDSHSITAGQSVVWLVHPRFNALVETLWTRISTSGRTATQTIVSPGVRWSYNLPGHLQVVPGIAFPIAYPDNEKSVFLYLSLEHPFRGAR